MVIIQINKRTQIFWTFQAPFFTVFTKSYCSNERPVSNTRIFRKVLPFWSWLFQQWLMKWCSDGLLQLAIAKRRVFFMLNLQEEMHYICLLVCLFIMEVSYFSLTWWCGCGEMILSCRNGKVSVKVGVCLGGVGWRLQTSQNAQTI